MDIQTKEILIGHCAGRVEEHSPEILEDSMPNGYFLYIALKVNGKKFCFKQVPCKELNEHIRDFVLRAYERAEGE